jgi:hypothetical protein
MIGLLSGRKQPWSVYGIAIIVSITIIMYAQDCGPGVIACSRVQHLLIVSVADNYRTEKGVVSHESTKVVEGEETLAPRSKAKS